MDLPMDPQFEIESVFHSGSSINQKPKFQTQIGNKKWGSYDS